MSNTHKNFKRTLALLPLLAAGSASAAIEGSVTLTSDYRLYGVSQTLEDPALQLELVYVDDSGFSAGTFISNVDFVEDSDPGDLEADLEVDLFVGYGWEIAEGQSIAATLIRYMYPDTLVGLNYNELIIDYGFQYGTFTIGYSNDAFGVDETGTRFEYAHGYDFNENVSLGFMIGHYDLDSAFDDSYTYYDLSLTYAMEAFSATLSYSDTSSQGEDLFGPAAEGAVVGTVSYAF